MMIPSLPLVLLCTLAASMTVGCGSASPEEGQSPVRAPASAPADDPAQDGAEETSESAAPTPEGPTLIRLTVAPPSSSVRHELVGRYGSQSGRIELREDGTFEGGYTEGYTKPAPEDLLSATSQQGRFEAERTSQLPDGTVTGRLTLDDGSMQKVFTFERPASGDLHVTRNGLTSIWVRSR